MALHKLKGRKDLVVARTDKTKSICVLSKVDYIDMVRKHLGKEAILSTRDELVKRQAQAKELLKDIGKRDILSTNEFSYIKSKSTITKKAVPTVKLLIKDHKKKNVETGNRNNAEYSRKTIKHACY